LNEIAPPRQLNRSALLDAIEPRSFTMICIRIVAALLATACLILGFLMGHRFEQGFGQTLFIAGAIIICGILISSAILELNKRK